MRTLTEGEYEALSIGAQNHYDKMVADQEHLPDELRVVGFKAIGCEWFTWLHPASRRSVNMGGPIAWKNVHGYGSFELPEPNADTIGYTVYWTKHDELGNPTDEWAGLFTVSRELAIRETIRLRQQILSETKRLPRKWRQTEMQVKP
jgi:hypothetical protein